MSFQLADPSFDHDYRLLWFRAGVFLSKRHPAEGPSISSGKKDCLKAMPQQLQNLSTTDTAVQAVYFKMFCCLLRKRMLVKTQGILWVDFKKETLFFSMKEITNFCPKESIKTTPKLLCPIYVSVCQSTQIFTLRSTAVVV